MEEVSELRNVLERVEGKLIAAGKIYSAMNFAIWLSIMLLYYVIIGLLDPSWKFNLVYWPMGFLLAMLFTGRIWKRLKRLSKVTGEGVESSTRSGILIGLSWGIGVVVGWILIPSWNPASNFEISLAMGFLSFISISVFGMWLIFVKFEPGKIEREMIPSFLIPAVGIPLLGAIGRGAMMWAGFVIGLGFSLTILWYLYSAFKAIER